MSGIAASQVVAFGCPPTLAGLRMNPKPRAQSWLKELPLGFDGGGVLIKQWLKNKDTALFLGVWVRIHNSDCNSRASTNMYRIN